MSLNNLASEISKAFEYIEKNLENRITLDDIANVSSLSKYHLHRMLSVIVNRPLMDYVRARKLCSSLEKLMTRSYRIIDIAAEYSFDYEQSYIRAFKKEFGLSPGIYRTHPTSIKLTKSIYPLHYTSLSNGVLIHPVYVYKPQINVIGIRTDIDIRKNRWDLTEAESSIDLLYNCYNEMNNLLKQDAYIGLTRLSGKNRDCKQYLSSVEVLSFEEIPKGYSHDTIPASNYAVFKYIGLFNIKHITLSQLEEIWEFILFVWIVKTNYQIADSFYFEMIDMCATKSNYCEIDFYIPIYGE